MLKNKLRVYPLLLFFLISGCKASVTDPEISLIETTIRRYNRALADAYRDMSVDPLQGIASEREMGKVNMILMGFRAKNQYMETELKGIEFERIERKGTDSADVETEESWRFRHLDKKTGQEVKPWVQEEYKLLYHMAKKDGSWIVASVEFVKAK